MCGILASYALKKNTVSSMEQKKEQLFQGLKSLYHRGPDGSQVWIKDHARVALGHVRLSIIDLSGGAQPLQTQDGKIRAVVNGEFYNYQSIRTELIQKGHVFRTHSDSEILLHLYKEHGTKCMEYLRGEFAFVLYDEVNDLIFAARDRVGIKPLYFVKHQDEILFSSEIKGLLAMGVPAVWDQDSYASRAFTLRQKTLFQGVSSVTPGHFVICQGSEIQSTSYWDFNFSSEREQIETHMPAVLTQKVHDTLYDCVAQRLIADVPIAVYLSGGLDSSVILALASKIQGRALPAFHLSFKDDPDFDEHDEAQIMAQHVGADFRPILITSDKLVDYFPQAIEHNEAPLLNSQAVAKFILSQHVRQAGYKVVLTGEGADEIFAGYPHFRKDLLTSGEPDYEVTWLTTVQRHVAELSQFYSSDLAAKAGFIEGKNAFFRQHHYHEKLKALHPVHAAMYLWSKAHLPNFVLTSLGDRMEMANSIEGRVPFLDHKLIELVSQLSVHHKISGRVQKHILREAARSYLPSSISQRKKHYFEAPPVLHRPESALYCFIQDTLRSSTLKELQFLNQTKIINALDSVAALSRSSAKVLEPILMEIVSLCYMQKKFDFKSH